jgi:hypothetical protein
MERSRRGVPGTLLGKPARPKAYMFPQRAISVELLGRVAPVPARRIT